MDIQTMRNTLQKEKIEGRERPWGYAIFQRGPSIYLTWFLAKTPITPNTISVLNILVGLGAVYAVSQTDFRWMLAGVLLLYLNLILDKTDGELARLKNKYSLQGVYLDEINHYLTAPLFFLALGWSLAQTSSVFSTETMLLAGTLTMFFALWTRLSHNLKYGIFIKKYRGQESLFDMDAPDTQSISELKQKTPLLGSIFWVLHQFQDQLWVVIATLAGLLYEYFFVAGFYFHPVLSWVLAGFAVLYIFIFIENSLKGFLQIKKDVSNLNGSHP